ncbi:hypothetical protein I4U23_010102 [Adineta vaga]|nr:hypothetical protein I4U23_010102 [Adineta vaga]
MMCNIRKYIKDYKSIFPLLILFYFISLSHTKSVQKINRCKRYLSTDNCLYYPCLDTHYFCGRENHLTRFTYEFCLLSTRKYISKLNLNAQVYFKQTNRCLMKSLDEQLVERTISARFTCTDLQRVISNNHMQCFQNSSTVSIDFCSIICENLQIILNLFLNLNYESPSLYHLLIETGKNCGANIPETISPSIASILISICLDRKNAKLNNDITNIMFNRRYEFNDYEWISD